MVGTKSRKSPKWYIMLSPTRTKGLPGGATNQKVNDQKKRRPFNLFKNIVHCLDEQYHMMTRYDGYIFSLSTQCKSINTPFLRAWEQGL